MGAKTRVRSMCADYHRDRVTSVGFFFFFLKAAGQWGRVLGMNPRETKDPRLLEALLHTHLTLLVFCLVRVLQPLSWGPDEPLAERLDGNPHPGHCVPLPAVWGQACLCWGLHHGWRALSSDRAAGALPGHPTTGAPLQETQGGKGGVCHTQSSGPCQLRYSPGPASLTIRESRPMLLSGTGGNQSLLPKTVLCLCHATSSKLSSVHRAGPKLESREKWGLLLLEPQLCSGPVLGSGTRQGWAGCWFLAVKESLWSPSPLTSRLQCREFRKGEVHHACIHLSSVGHLQQTGKPRSQFQIPQKAVGLGLPGPTLEMFSDHRHGIPL